jgi:chloramphenicol-sensitive protein RarD
VIHGQILAVSAGYFINPLVNVALGMLVLGERLRRLQLAAVGLAAVGVLPLAATGGAQTGVALGLALSFAFYGLVRKVAPVDAFEGLFIETALLAPLALGWLLWTGPAGAFGHDRSLDALLLAAGVVTAVPLLLFAGAARRLRYTTLGLFQYIAPTLQFLQAVLLFGETLRPVHLFTFGCIWTGLALYAFDSLRGGSAMPVTAD